MRILREAYTAEEIEQRISDTRNIITALEDSLYILVSALDEYGDPDTAAVARDYVNETHDMFVNFTNVFDSYVPEQPVEDDFIEDEFVEESLEEDVNSEKKSDFIEAVKICNNYNSFTAQINDYNQQKRAEERNKLFDAQFNDIMNKYGIKSNGVPIECQNKGNDTIQALKNWVNKNKSLEEDTVKTSDGKWVNKGDTGETHGKFKTKKEADAQRKAMFANGWKK